MMRVVMVVLMSVIASCAVDSAPTETVPPSTSAATAADSDNTEVSRSAVDRDADPDLGFCPFSCTSLAQCQALRGIVHGTCNIPGTACCQLVD